MLTSALHGFLERDREENGNLDSRSGDVGSWTGVNGVVPWHFGGLVGDTTFSSVDRF